VVSKLSELKENVPRLGHAKAGEALIKMLQVHGEANIVIAEQVKKIGRLIGHIQVAR
jgi:hypothetical protein